MKWQGREESSNVERRSGGLGMPIKVGGPGVLILALIIMLMGGNPMSILGGQVEPQQQQQSAPSAEVEHLQDFMAVVLKDTEDVWSEIFKTDPLIHGDYQKPNLVLYNDYVSSGCGQAVKDNGPFYCPADRKVYMDVTFYRDLVQRYGAKGGDYAMVYVLAHEIGHHVQEQLGLMKNREFYAQNLSKTEYNRYSQAIELQADYFAGVFTKHIEQKGYLEQGDIEEAMSAAASVGDDRIQSNMYGRVVPDTFTHGSAKDRVAWFMRGYQYGDIEHGDTFSALGVRP